MPEYRTESLPALLRARAAEMPDRVYVVDVDDRQLTYSQMAEWMQRWAAAFKRVGVVAGECVVSMQFNTIESLAGWLGLASLGVVEAAINTDYRGDLLVHALNITRCRTMVLSRQFLDRVRDVADELKYLKTVVIVDTDSHLDDFPFAAVTARDFFSGIRLEPFERNPEISDIAAVLFTSGTTGPSKAVQMPWGQLLATARYSLPLDDLNAGDVFFNAGPSYHIGAKVFPYQAALLGARHVIRPYVSESRLSAEYRKYGVTTCFYPPLMWLDEPARPDDADCALRNLLFPIPLPQMAEFKKRFGCRTYSVYSMTELSCPIADVTWDIGHINPQGYFSCGKLRSGFPGYEARIVDNMDREVAPGIVGELVVRASEPWGMNAGYLNNPEATAAAWRNGWFHTGDAFFRDEDGYFYFRDRLKDCIRRKAENISSFEVEGSVKKHPAVADCAAVAAKMSEDPTADEEIRLVVMRKPDSELSAEELIRWMIPRVPRFMIPRFVEFMDELPRTPNLKIQKAVLRKSPMRKDVWDRDAAGIELPR